MALISAAVLLVLALTPSVWAADGATSAGSTWADVQAALAGLALLAISIIAGVLISLRGVLIEYLAARARALTEEATGARVARIDDALQTGLAAGLEPTEAAEAAARKLPATLARSGKTVEDLAAEAGVQFDALNRRVK
ncbi:hypothetical protein [Pseudoxanthobacter soli]|uniref:hypothetical protein n=1 Tax=Pseudoxanthobacter soli TaxID=433840 RepID=UPI001114C378|nr:hypothetical protein [Pseudoxanthobacter soli]